MTFYRVYIVYIFTNVSRRPLYTGFSGFFPRRSLQHKFKLLDGYTARYNLTRLVYYEEHNNVHAAIAREKEIKGWSRAKKIELIEGVNPRWDDLTEYLPRFPFGKHRGIENLQQSKSKTQIPRG